MKSLALLILTLPAAWSVTPIGQLSDVLENRVSNGTRGRAIAPEPPNDATAPECALCLDALTQDTDEHGSPLGPVVTLPAPRQGVCGHKYHQHCLDRLTAGGNTECPKCRTTIPEEYRLRDPSKGPRSAQEVPSHNIIERWKRVVEAIDRDRRDAQVARRPEAPIPSFEVVVIVHRRGGRRKCPSPGGIIKQAVRAACCLTVCSCSMSGFVAAAVLDLGKTRFCEGHCPCYTGWFGWHDMGSRPSSRRRRRRRSPTPPPTPVASRRTPCLVTSDQLESCQCEKDYATWSLKAAGLNIIFIVAVLVVCCLLGGRKH